MEYNVARQFEWTDEERAAALIDAVFGDGPNPYRPAVFPDQVLREWIESTEEAIAALRRWLGNLQG